MHRENISYRLAQKPPLKKFHPIYSLILTRTMYLCKCAVLRCILVSSQLLCMLVRRNNDCIRVWFYHITVQPAHTASTTSLASTFTSLRTGVHSMLDLIKKKTSDMTTKRS